MEDDAFDQVAAAFAEVHDLTALRGSKRIDHEDRERLALICCGYLTRAHDEDDLELVRKAIDADAHAIAAILASDAALSASHDPEIDTRGVFGPLREDLQPLARVAMARRSALELDLSHAGPHAGLAEEMAFGAMAAERTDATGAPAEHA